MRIKQSLLQNTFLTVVMLELLLLGSGRVIEIGPLTLRMVLFIIAIGYSTILIIKRNKIAPELILLLSIFFVSCLLAISVGVSHGAAASLIFEDVKPLSYFLMLIFFWAVIEDIETIGLATNVVKTSALLLALFYLVFLLLRYFGVIHLDANVITMFENSKGGDIRFQTDNIGVYYSGFLCLGMGFFFYIFERGMINKIKAAVILTAIVFTFTRGFLIATIATVLIYGIARIFSSKLRIKYLVYVALTVVLVAMLGSAYLDIVGARHVDMSDAVRINTINQVREAVTPLSLIIGQGFGIGVPQRLVHMEISYLEIFHKQGIIGLLFWSILFIVIMKKYFNASGNRNSRMALPFMLSTLYIFIVTATNNYMNNPLGMWVLLISIVVLNILGKNRCSAITEENTIQ